MKTKLSFFVAPIAVVGCLVAALIVLRRPQPQRTHSTPGAQAHRITAPVVAPAVPKPETSLPDETVASAESAPPEQPRTSKTPAASATQGAQPQENHQDPLAREAMALVGVDPEAEAYWLAAIHDPTLSDSEREDLIEDLNESGFSNANGREATLADLWIVENRIDLLIELKELGPDDFMASHIDEALKDLTNIDNRLRGQ
jgi:hypothetical protein